MSDSNLHPIMQGVFAPHMPSTTELLPGQRQPSGVRWSGMSDEPSFTPTPEAQAKAQAAYLKAKARMDAEVAEYAARTGLLRKDVA